MLLRRLFCSSGNGVCNQCAEICGVDDVQGEQFIDGPECVHAKHLGHFGKTDCIVTAFCIGSDQRAGEIADGENTDGFIRGYHSGLFNHVLRDFGSSDSRVPSYCLFHRISDAFEM